MKHWIVVSPETWATIPVLDDGSGPLEYFCYAVSVEAETRKEAKRIALHTPEMQGWVDQQRGDNRNPLWGLRVSDPVCDHGVCLCDLCHRECEECVAEIEADYRRSVSPR